MENPASKDEKSLVLKRIEAIGNREVDAMDSERQLREYLTSSDHDIVLAAIQASAPFVADQPLFEQILALADRHVDEEVRGMAASCLGNVIFDGLEFEDALPEGMEVPAPLSHPEFYATVKDFLFSRVDALMESMEVRRRVVEALG
ncbi:MAG TPA: hypothetical protein VKZ88_03130, partial [Fibrobacteria bacterium]|nr:hypothetical protein [Fibrobacteria bacterium]